MPIHDWTRVEAGLFHDFHHAWIEDTKRALNAGRLPPGYVALAEQVTGGSIPDVLTLQTPRRPTRPVDQSGGVAVADAPPRTTFVRQADDEDVYAARANHIAIHHPRGTVVAVIEIVSPGNKSGRAALRSFVEKSAEFLRHGVHLLVIDVFPPTPRDPGGIHKAIWDEIREEPFELPPGKPLTLAAYSAGVPKTAYVEPVAVGDRLPDMPLFLEPGLYVPVPLEDTYQTSWAAFPAEIAPELERP
jgi:hypothetical protein